MNAAPTLGQLVDALDVNLEAMLVVAKRSGKVIPNGTLRSAVDQMRDVQSTLKSVQSREPRR